MIPATGLPQVVALHNLVESRSLMERLGVSEGGVDIMDKKGLFRVLRVKGLDTRAASILKQEMLSRGGEVATSREVYELQGGKAECLVMGTLSQFERLLPKLRSQPFGLRVLAESMAAALEQYDAPGRVTHPLLDLSAPPVVMGVINVTPDSFSDGGDFLDTAGAVARAQQMVEEGAQLLDVGADSSRPWSQGTDVEEEMRRLLPVLRALGSGFPIPVSVDTRRAAVAAAALEAGASLVNDISALRADPEMAAVVRDAGCPLILMHMLGTPATMQDNPVYEDVVEEVYSFFVERLSFAVDEGIAEANLLVDPGIGFGKTLEHNLQLLRQLGGFRSLGRPLVLGASRKAFLGRLLDQPEPKGRLIGTVATTALAGMQGVDIVRVHDVKENVEAARVARAVMSGSLGS